MVGPSESLCNQSTLLAYALVVVFQHPLHIYRVTPHLLSSSLYCCQGCLCCEGHWRLSFKTSVLLEVLYAFELPSLASHLVVPWIRPNLLSQRPRPELCCLPRPPLDPDLITKTRTDFDIIFPVCEQQMQMWMSPEWPIQCPPVSNSYPSHFPEIC